MSSHTWPNDEPYGTLAWGQRTGGLLSRRERRHMLRASVRATAALFSSRLLLAAGRRGTATAPLSVIDVPDTALAREVERVALEGQSPELFGHALRTVAFAHALAALDGVEADPELLWCASLLHDVAIEHPAPGRCFAVRGGEIAAAAAERAGAGPGTVQLLGDAVSLHATPGLDPGRYPLPSLVYHGALVDVLGARLHQLDPGFVRALLAAHPREGFSQAVASAWQSEVRAVPGGRAALAERPFCFSLAARLAPRPR